MLMLGMYFDRCMKCARSFQAAHMARVQCCSTRCCWPLPTSAVARRSMIFGSCTSFTGTSAPGCTWILWMRCQPSSPMASSWFSFPTKGSPGATPVRTRGSIARRRAEQVSFFCSQGTENLSVTTEAFESVPHGWMDDVAALRRRRPPATRRAAACPCLACISICA